MEIRPDRGGGVLADLVGVNPLSHDRATEAANDRR
jgi:hypothetical protein